MTTVQQKPTRWFQTALSSIHRKSVQEQGAHLIPDTTAPELLLSNIYIVRRRHVVGDRQSQPVEFGVSVGYWDIRCMPIGRNVPGILIKHAASESFTLARKNVTFVVSTRRGCANSISIWRLVAF